MKQTFLSLLLLFSGFLTYSNVRINEIVSDNTTGVQDAFGDYSDWIELHNSGSTAVNLAGYYLSDNDANFSKWTFPSVTIPANGYLVVFASGNNQVINNEVHTNFSISKNGEPIVLSSPTGTLIELVQLPSLAPNTSYSKSPTNTWYFAAPTFGQLNAAQPPAAPNIPTSSHAAGFYSTPINVTYTCSQATDQVVSLDFHGQVTSVLTSGSKQINTNTVMRVACRNSNQVLSAAKTDSYFIGQNSSLPVVSLSVNHDEMFGPNGIYTNYNNEQELIGHAEYFDKQKNEVFDLDLKVELHGSITKMFPMKSLRLTATASLGTPKIEGQLFSDRPYSSFKQLVLRNSGNDYNRLLYRDLLNSRIARQTNVDWLAGQPVLVFVNGAFQGLYNMRERTNTDLMESVHGVDPGNVDYFDNNGFINYPGLSNELDEIREGTNEHFQQVFNYIIAGNAQTSGGYNQVKQWIDIENFIDYFALEIYHTNWDWPHNNVRFWRPRTATGKWRYIYFDTDFGLNLFGEARTRFDLNELQRVMNTTNSAHALMFKTLMDVPEFTCAFVSRMNYLMQNVVSPQNYLAKMQELETEISAEIPRQFAKYTDQMACCRSQEVAWATNFINNRPSYMQQHLAALGSCAPPEDTTTTPPGNGICISNLPNTSTNWLLRNDWSDANSGSHIVNTSEGIQVNHRAWGYQNFWLGYQTQVNLIAGKTYQVEFDVKDNASSLGLQLMQALFTSGMNWNCPLSGQTPATITGPFSKSGYTTKTTQLSVNQTGNYYLALKFELGNQPSAATSYLLKNIKICEVSNGMRLSNADLDTEQVQSVNDASYTVTVYKSDGTKLYSHNKQGSHNLQLDNTLAPGLYIMKLESQNDIQTYKILKQ